MVNLNEVGKTVKLLPATHLLVKKEIGRRLVSEGKHYTIGEIVDDALKRMEKKK